MWGARDDAREQRRVRSRDEQVALDTHGRSTGMTGLPGRGGGPACRRVGQAHVSGAGSSTDTSLTHRGVRLAAYAASGGGGCRGGAVINRPVVASGLTPGRWGSRKATFGLLPMLDPSERTPGDPDPEARGLTKRYGRTQALAGLDLVAQPGRMVALLGLNGAKTTFIRTVATLLHPDAGTLSVAGIDGCANRRRCGG